MQLTAEQMAAGCMHAPANEENVRAVCRALFDLLGVEGGDDPFTLADYRQTWRLKIFRVRFEVLSTLIAAQGKDPYEGLQPFLLRHLGKEKANTFMRLLEFRFLTP